VESMKIEDPEEEKSRDCESEVLNAGRLGGVERPV